jgi:hypothetical protein
VFATYKDAVVTITERNVEATIRTGVHEIGSAAQQAIYEFETDPAWMNANGLVWTAVLDSDVCPACFGRGYKVVPGTPMLSDEGCVECKGSGRREIQGEAEQALVDLIKRLEREIGAALMQKLSSRMEP